MFCFHHTDSGIGGRAPFGRRFSAESTPPHCLVFLFCQFKHFFTKNICPPCMQISHNLAKTGNGSYLLFKHVNLQIKTHKLRKIWNTVFSISQVIILSRANVLWYHDLWYYVRACVCIFALQILKQTVSKLYRRE